MNHRLITLPLLLLVLLLITPAVNASPAEKKDDWEAYKTPEEAGFSSEKIQIARDYWETLRPDAGATIVVYKGKILVAWGEISYKYMCHSVRKSFLSALYGIHVDEGNIDLEKTMAELGIDDDPPLTEQEKQAKVIQLLMARSGVYHTAAAEAPEMQANRPARGSHAPGTFWYYNNWDFNTLGTIFRQETGKDIYQEFEDRIAGPIGMQDYKPSDSDYSYELHYSIHPAYPFRMTARDRARFGQLFLQQGRWGDQQIVPAKWVRKSTSALSDASEGNPDFVGLGYGYMWWTIDRSLLSRLPVSTENHMAELSVFMANGYRGHMITVVPDAEIVFVMCVNTDLGVFNVEVTAIESFEIFNLILDAKQFEIVDLAAEKVWTPRKTAAPGDPLKLSARIRNLSKAKSEKTTVGFYLSKNKKLDSTDILLGEASLPKLLGGKKKTVRLKTNLPDNITAGNYYLLAYADRENENGDPHTGNNLVVSGKKIGVR